MDYGAKYARWAPQTASETGAAGTFPKYGPAVSLGALNKVSDTPAFNEAKGYGDNAMKVYVARFKECPIQMEVTDLPRSVMSAVSGAEIAVGTQENMRFSASDNPPYGGFGFYINKITDDKRDVCVGIFYPNVKAVLQGTEYNTSGDNITLSTDKLQFMASACESGEWRIYSRYFDTEAEASAWVDGCFTGASLEAGGETTE